jgi:hypothetical protein
MHGSKGKTVAGGLSCEQLTKQEERYQVLTGKKKIFSLIMRVLESHANFAGSASNFFLQPGAQK